MSESPHRPNWAEIATAATSAISLLVSIAAVVVVLRSIEPVQDSLRSSAYHNVTAGLLEVNKTFAEPHNAEFWPYFRESRRVPFGPDDTRLARIKALADLQLDFFDSFYTQSEYLPGVRKGTDEHDAWNRFIAESFARSPVMCERLKEVQGWYTAAFVSQAVVPCREWEVQFSNVEAGLQRD